MLCVLKGQSNLPWLCARDFNEFLLKDEKIRGNVRLEWKMAQFREAIEDCNLNELPVAGARLTWYVGNRSNVVYERLVKGLCSNDWLEKFPYSIEEHLMATTSDHLLLCFHVDKHQERIRTPRAKFKFENMLVRSDQCAKVMEEAWNNQDVISQPCIGP